MRSARITHGFTRFRRAAAQLSRVHGWLYARTGGRFLPRWFGGNVIAIETVGRKSGRRRTNPLVCARDGERFLVMASNAGSPSTPAWWLNLKAAGEGTVVDRGRRLRVRPRELEGEERERLLPAYFAAYPPGREYSRFTRRRLPLIALEPLRQPDADGP